MTGIFSKVPPKVKLLIWRLGLWVHTSTQRDEWLIVEIINMGLFVDAILASKGASSPTNRHFPYFLNNLSIPRRVLTTLRWRTSTTTTNFTLRPSLRKSSNCIHPCCDRRQSPRGRLTVEPRPPSPVVGLCLTNQGTKLRWASFR